MPGAERVTAPSAAVRDFLRSAPRGDSAGVRRAIADDVAEELASIDRALLGDLAGRAAQAVMLTRLDASPVQIAAADRLLHADPLRPARHLLDRLLMALLACGAVYGAYRPDVESAFRTEADRSAARLFGAAVSTSE